MKKSVLKFEFMKGIIICMIAHFVEICMCYGSVPNISHKVFFPLQSSDTHKVYSLFEVYFQPIPISFD